MGSFDKDCYFHFSEKGFSNSDFGSKNIKWKPIVDPQLSAENKKQLYYYRLYHMRI